MLYIYSENPYFCGHMPKTSRIKKFLNQRHKLMLMHAETFEPKRTFHITNQKLILWSLALFLASFALSYFVIAFTPLKTTLSGYTDPEAEKKQVELIRQINEMKIIVSKQDSFIHSIQRMSGFVSLDSSKTPKEQRVTYLPKDYLKKVQEEYDKKQIYESENPQKLKDVELKGKALVLFPPVNGLLVNKFDILEHLGIDIGSKSNEPVKAVAAGYILFTEFSNENGWIIGVAHEGNVVSLYKHNAKILKKVGAYVKAGEPIAVVGNTGENSTGPHLHFELWINGKPVNPLDYFSYIEK